jgi:hypothetical protein
MSSKITYSAAQLHRAELKDWFDCRGYLEIWENGEVRLIRRHSSEGTPERAWNQRDVEFRFSGPTIKSMVTFVNGDAMQALIKTLSEGHSVEWNGHNHHGVFTPAAREAMNRIEAAIYQYHDRS